MKTSLYALLVTFLLAGQLTAFDSVGYVGPHFNYTRVDFNTPSHIEGYQAGVTAGVTSFHRCYFGALDFEGTWDAGPITGNPCQKSSLSEYFLELKFGRCFRWCRAWARPYIGFGWDQFQNRQDPGRARLRYRYDKLFVPLGVYFQWEICQWDLGLQLEWRPDVWSNLELIGIDLNPSWGHGFRVQLPVTRFYDCCGCITLEVAPFFDWNRFGEVGLTNSAGAPLVIPRLVRWNAGLRALIGYSF